MERAKTFSYQPNFRGIKDAGVNNTLLQTESKIYLNENLSFKLTSPELETFKSVLDKYPHSDGSDIFALSTITEFNAEQAQSGELNGRFKPFFKEIKLNGHNVEVKNENLAILAQINQLMLKIQNNQVSIGFPEHTLSKHVAMTRLKIFKDTSAENFQKMMATSKFDYQTLNSTAKSIFHGITGSIRKYFTL